MALTECQAKNAIFLRAPIGALKKLFEEKTRRLVSGNRDILLSELRITYYVEFGSLIQYKYIIWDLVHPRISKWGTGHALREHVKKTFSWTIR